MSDMRNALKALGAVFAVVALCAPLMLLPADDTQLAVVGGVGVTVTVPPTVVVQATIPGLETTTTTTEAAPVLPAEPAPTTTTTAAPIDITIAAAGDIVVPQSLLDSVRDTKNNSYDFAPVFAPVAPYLSKADYTVAALDPLLAGPKEGYSASPTPNAPRELAFALKQAGVDLLATANPHSLDLGWSGLVGTLDRLDAAGLAHVGTSRSQKERSTPVIEDIRGIRVAFLDYTASVAKAFSDTTTTITESNAGSSTTTEKKRTTKTTSAKTKTTSTTAKTTSTTTKGTSTATTVTTEADNKAAYAVNILDPETVRQDAMTARSWGADVVVAFLNYGTEFAEQPSAEQKQLSEDILKSGVDVILGCHAHVVQPIGHIFTIASFASYKTSSGYVAYSLGDLAPAQQTDAPEGGLIAYLHIEKLGLRAYVTGVSYLPLYFQASTDDKPAKYRVLPVLPGLEPDTDVPLTDADRQKMAETWNDARTQLYRPDENISPLSSANLGN
jgi:poly-gamma-glutamate capsule biosynthesis protein CapA/YwtB (metallophosphatase superfamily)